MHAPLQVVQFYADQHLESDRLIKRLNSLLPHDIRVLAAARTAPDFSATRSATGKVRSRLCSAARRSGQMQRYG